MSNLTGQEKEKNLGAQKRHEQAPTMVVAPCRIDGMRTGNNTSLLNGSFPIAITYLPH
jgi:hypothetical protein